MNNFTDLLELAEKNKDKHTHEDKEATYERLILEQTYPALIMDAEYVKESSAIELELVVMKGSSCIEKTFSFKVFNGSSVWYDEICETLGTDGEPSDLIGKCIYMHIEKNGKYQNLCVEGEMDKEEFEEMISGIDRKSDKEKKKVGYRKPTRKTPIPKKTFDKKNEEAEGEDGMEEELLDDEE